MKGGVGQRLEKNMTSSPRGRTLNTNLCSPWALTSSTVPGRVLRHLWMEHVPAAVQKQGWDEKKIMLCTIRLSFSDPSSAELRVLHHGRDGEKRESSFARELFYRLSLFHGYVVTSEMFLFSSHKRRTPL